MLGIVLINYNSEEELIEYISNELSKTTVENKIVVVDNSYTHEKHEVLKSKLCQINVRTFNKDLFLITKKENLGYAKANNFGALFLKDKIQPDYMLFSNTDIEFTVYTVVEDLISKLDSLPVKYAAIGPRVIGEDGFDQSPKEKINFKRYFAWKFFPFLRGNFSFLRKKKEIKNNSFKGQECYQLSGCFLLIKAKDFFESGLFDEATFLYGEEKILSERLKSINKYNFFYPHVSITHHESSIVNKNIISKNVRKMQHNNNCYYYQHYLGAPKPLVFFLKYFTI